MTEPVSARTNPGQYIEAELREIAGADPGVTARRAPSRHETESFVDAAIHDAEIHGAAHAVEHGFAEVGLTRAAMATHIGVAVVTPLLALSEVIIDGDERALATRHGMQHDRMRGALAVLEGRIGSDEVQAEMARNPSFADGVHRAEGLASTMSTRELTELMGVVRRSGNDGQAAVCLGRDHGAAFDRRYQSDPAFAHGVDFARRLETDSPGDFAARREQFRSLEAQQNAARHSTPIRS
jgi:hypothetical protein